MSNLPRAKDTQISTHYLDRLLLRKTITILTSLRERIASLNVLALTSKRKIVYLKNLSDYVG